MKTMGTSGQKSGNDRPGHAGSRERPCGSVIRATSRRRTAALSALLGSFLVLAACGDAVKSSTTGTGSDTITVGGSSVTGGIVKIDVSSNRTKIAVGDVALITIHISCAQVSGTCPLTDSTGSPIFAAHPITSTDTTAQKLDVIANFTSSAAGTVSKSTDTFTLAAGTAATSTTAAVLGGTVKTITFSISVTGAKEGAAIFTAQSLNTTATLIIDVFNNSSAIFK
ncbi:MAG: hypothetical protein HY579_02910 [Nitrospinae bacterium]|nr:hypothetical protein [Nitrospinota bacterium]